jgi:hypothetical protein
MNRSAIISPCQTYRYELWREWDSMRPVVAFIGLNPSAADAERDDPTIRRCLGFAKSWGCGSLVMLNLFALRSTDPAAIRSTPNPVGPDNDAHIVARTRGVDIIVAAWGNDGGYLGRDVVVERLIADSRPSCGGISCLKLTKSGSPWHPLYVPKTAKLIPYRTGGVA